MGRYSDILRKQIKDDSLEGASDRSSEKDIAVIGMACRFPGAPDLGSFWDMLVEGREGIAEIPASRWDWREHFDENSEASDKAYNRWGGFLEGIDQFDSLFFNISPKEALLMDPQQRLFLEIAWRTLEHAGYAGEALAGTETGVFVGCTNVHYSRRYRLIEEQEDYYISTVGNWNAVLPSRVSYYFDLRGPSMLIDTLCSSSLVALHSACQSLIRQECEAALVGGVNLILTPEHYIAGSKLKAHSPDGRCKAFDHRANGFTSGEGVAAVLLKPLAKAITDKDTIYGVVKGAATNHDGRTNGIMAPNPDAQSRVIKRALNDADVDAESISYVECHGTGTRLGDPIEIEGLSRAYRKQVDRSQYCAIGSVKTNIGHLEAAAGLAGLIKTLLSLCNKQLPPSLNYEKHNPLIPFSDSPFFVNTELRPWASDGPRRGGISSFGLSGVNAHVILQEAPGVENVSLSKRSIFLLVVSARTEKALNTLLERYGAYLRACKDVSLDDLCWTASVGSGHYGFRVALLVNSKQDAINTLKDVVGSLQQGYANSNAIYYGEIGIDEEIPAVAHSPEDIAELEWMTRLRECAVRYVNGEQIDWKQVYEGESLRRVPLPAYPFETNSYWPKSELGETGSRELNLQKLGRLPISHPLLGQKIMDTRARFDKKTM